MKLISIFLLMSTLTMQAQDSLPFRSIETYPEEMRLGSIMARMIDGLGFRYYWATEGLVDADLQYKASETSRTSQETLEHILGLSNFVATVAANKPIVRPGSSEELSWQSMRSTTLQNLHAARETFVVMDDKDLEALVITFQRGENTSEVPFWNLLNGPLADAIYHVGQIVSNRRASGNPMDPAVNVFMGRRQ